MTGWCNACERQHVCWHCHDDPPLGHTCPACSRPAADLVTAWQKYQATAGASS